VVYEVNYAKPEFLNNSLNALGMQCELSMDIALQRRFRKPDSLFTIGSPKKVFDSIPNMSRFL
jgi:hypothetical protein